MIALDFKKQDRTAAGWLLDYDYRKQAYKEASERFSTLGATVNTGLPHGSGVGNPTERKVMTLAELDRQRLWIKTVEDATRTLGDKKRAFLQLRRLAESIDNGGEVGRPSWIDFVQIRFADWHERKYGKAFIPAKRTMFCWWNEIVETTVRIAIRRGLL